MQFLKKLTKNILNKNNLVSGPSITDLKNDPNIIQAYDHYGRPIFITKDQWKKNILIPNLKKHKKDPDPLYSIMASALADGFYEDLLEPSEWLFKSDYDKERAYCMRGVVLNANGKFTAAEETFRKYLKKYGDSSIIKVNLSKILFSRGEENLSRDTLFEALTIDPNQEDGLFFWGAFHNEENNTEDYIKAMMQIAKLEGSWRPQLWIARSYLEMGREQDAFELYENILPLVTEKPDALMMISGDLGNHHKIEKLIELIAPLYKTDEKFVLVGMNLLEAYIQIKDKSHAKDLLEKLYSLNRPDLKERLSASEKTIDDLFECNTSIDHEQLRLRLISLSKPLWLYGLENPRWLIEEKDINSPRIGILSLANLSPSLRTLKETSHKEDDLGRMTRAFACLLGEQFYCKTDFQTQVLVPCVNSDGAYLVFGSEYDQDSVMKIAKEYSQPLDYIISGYLKLINENLEVVLNLWDVPNNRKLKSLSRIFSSDDGFLKIRTLMDELLDAIGTNPKIQSSFYTFPCDNLSSYLCVLGQILALVKTAENEGELDSIYGIRNIIDSCLNLSLINQKSEIPVYMAISALRNLKAAKSEIYKEYQEKIYHLVRDNLPHDKAALIRPIIDHMYDEKLSIPENTANSSYNEWVENLLRE